MVVRTLAIAVVLLVAGTLTSAQAAISTAPTGQKAWYWQNPLPQGNTLNAVATAGTSDVWAVGNAGVVLHSSDNGAVWDSQDPNAVAASTILRGVDFPDAQHGWVVGDANTVRVTSDGGSTWAAQALTGTSRTLYSVSMATTQTGWLCGQAGTVRQTSNGGASWTLQTMPAGVSPTFESVSAADSNHAWVVGTLGTIVHTTNGSSWTTQTSGVSTTLYGVSFVDMQTGYATGASGVVLKTVDGGTTWTSLSVHYLDATSNPTTLTASMQSVSFRDASTGWIAGATGLVLFTQDGGVTWTSQKAGALTLYGVAAGSGATAQVVGTYGVVYRTLTNGLSWLSQQQGTTTRLNGASWTGPTAGIVVGAAGLVMTTQDSGDSWSSRTLGSNDLYGVKFVDSADGWIVGSGGLIRKTLDAGSTWVPQVSGTTQILYSVTGVSASTAWAVGANGTILKTVDGGTTWVSKPSGTTQILYGVCFIDANRGWAVGAGGVVKATSDGGETWTTQTSGQTQTIYSVYFTDANNGWFTSTAGRLRHTTNGGTTWVAQTTNTALALYSIQMADTNTGWAVGGASTSSVVLRTVNGGITWTLQNAGFTGILRQITVGNGTVAGLVGDAGCMRRTFDGGATWDPSGFWSTTTYNQLSFADAQVGFVVGAGGAIAHTDDGGYTWAAQSSGAGNTALNDVSCVSPTNAWVVGAGGLVRETTDGVKWNPLTSGTTSVLNGVDFKDANTGWAVGAAGTIINTTNGGSTWVAQGSTLATNNTLWGVAAVATQTAYVWGGVAGSLGAVFKTTDGGSTWTTSTVTTSSILYGGSFVSSQTGWVCGQSGKVFKTTDGGSTWTSEVANAGTANLQSVSAVDSSTVYLVGDTGIVRKTSDGGATWATQLPGTYWQLLGVAFTDANHGWLVGLNGTILRTTDNTPPSTSLVVDPPAPNGNNNWYIGQPEISLVSNEPGITYYSWTSAAGPWTTYSEPISPPTDGILTIYWYSIDPGGNKEAVNSQMGMIDATPPSTPSTPTAAAQSTTSVQLTWPAATDVTSGMSHYAVYDGGSGSLIGTTTVASMTVSALATETAYSYQVSAIDMAGNESTKSPVVSVWTLGDPPVTSISGVPGNWSSTPVTFTLSATDSSSGVKASYYRLNAGATTTYTAPVAISTPGTTTISYWSVDNAGDVEASKNATALVDTVPPYTTISVAPAGWTSGTVTFSLSATDTYSGVYATYYRLNSGATTTYTAPVAISAPGTTTISYWSVDSAGGTETSKTAYSRIDTTAPVTTISGVPSGWTPSDATITLAATDAQSGVAATYYSLNGALAQLYSAPLVISTEGTNTVAYWSVDSLGNVETSKTATVSVDKNAPVSTMSGVPGGWSSTTVTFTLSASDALSGVNTTYYRLDSGATTTYTAPVAISTNGTTIVRYWSVDNAGNIETSKTASVQIDSGTFATSISGVPSTWTTDTIAFTLTAGGGFAGVKATYYELDSGAVTTYTAPVAVSADGTTTISYWSVDNANNVEATKTAYALIDRVAPVTTAFGLPAGWTSSNATITLSASDLYSGVASTYYSLNTGMAQVYTTPIYVSSEGTTAISYWSQDLATNLEAPTNALVRVDRTPPSAPGTPTVPTVLPTSLVASWSPSADAVSGVAYYQVLANGSVFATSTVPSATVTGLLPETSYTLAVAAIDQAGNVSTLSPSVQVGTLAAQGRPPVAVYTRAVGGAGVFVDWSESTGTVPPASYRVWRSAGGGSYSAIATITAGQSLSYEDTAPPFFSQLVYRVSETDERGEGPKSTPTTYTSTIATALPAPVSITASNTASVLVSWTPVASPSVVGYHVYRSTTSTGTLETQTVVPVAQPGSGYASYHDTHTADYTEYWYRVATVDGSGNVSAPSRPVYIRTAAAAVGGSPHGSYTQDTDFCALCHATHSSSSPTALLRGTDTIDAPLCLSCHDGTSASDVLHEYTDDSRTSRHSVAVDDAHTGTLQCSTCHGVHSAEQTGTVKGLLFAGGKKSGNEYCYACHGSTAGSNPGGNLQVFEGSTHATAIAPPSTGTKVVCLSCHVAHSSREAALFPYSGDDRCLGCHSNGVLASPAPSGTVDIASRLSGADASTRHDLLTADSAATGSRLSCANCHEPHSASVTTPCVSPDNPSTSGGMAVGVAFCLKCHDGVLPTSVQTSIWAQSPLGAGGATTTVDIATAWITNFHGDATTPTTDLRPEMGYSQGDTMTCETCHDAHGSTNRFALLERVPAKTGTLTADALLVVPMDGGGADLRFFCASCHTVNAATHPPVSAGGADLTVFPLDCTASGCHKHVGNGL